MKNQSNLAQSIKAFRDLLIALFFLGLLFVLAWPRVAVYLNSSTAAQPPVQPVIMVTEVTTVKEVVIQEQPATVIEITTITPPTTAPQPVPTIHNEGQHPITSSFSNEACEQASNSGRRSSPRCGSITPTAIGAGR